MIGFAQQVAAADAGALTPIVEQSAAELGSEASKQQTAEGAASMPAADGTAGETSKLCVRAYQNADKRCMR